MQDKVAIIGAGGSAKSYVETSLGKDQSFDLFTTDGNGSIGDVKSIKIKDLDPSNYEKIIIAIYRYNEVLKYFDESQRGKVFWYDNLKKSLSVIEDFFDEQGDNFHKSEDTLCAIYDLRIAPPTYDFLNFLNICEIKREEKGLQWLKVLIAPGNQDGFRVDLIQKYGRENLDDRINNLLLPLVRFCNENASVFYSKDREECRRIYENSIYKYPETHDFAFPQPSHFYWEFFPYIEKGIEHRKLKSNPYYDKKISEWFEYNNLNPKKIVVFTIRENIAYTFRNTPIEEYRKLASLLHLHGLQVVLVRDTLTCHRKLCWDSVIECNLAAMNIFYRQALYYNCLFNVMSSTGSVAINHLYAHSKFIIFGIYNQRQKASDLPHLEKTGTPKGQNRIGYGKGQFVSWVDETSEKMFKEIIKYCEEHLDFKINEANS